MTKDFYHSGNFKGFRSSVPKMGTKTKYVFLIINHSITPPPNLWLETMMCFSRSCGLVIWAGFVWLVLLPCVASVGVTHLSAFSWWLGWVRQGNRVSTHWSDTFNVASPSSVLSSRSLSMVFVSSGTSWISLQPGGWLPGVRVDAVSPGTGASSLLPYSVVRASHRVSPDSGREKYVLISWWAEQHGSRVEGIDGDCPWREPIPDR